MTAKELGQIHQLKVETAMYADKLNELEHYATKEATPELLEEIAKTKDFYTKKQLETQRLLNRILEFVDSIDDSLIRLIVQYRYVDCEPWHRVAAQIGCKCSPDSARMLCSRYLTNNKS